MHESLSAMARSKKLSLNQLCVSLLADGLKAKVQDPEPAFFEDLRALSLQLKKHFGPTLCGTALFGSYATGDATSASDIDLLIVLNRGTPIERSLYKWWDDNVIWYEGATLNPHFVNIPDDAERAGGLWLEVATAGRILYESGSALTDLFKKIKELIDEGRVRRYTSNGHSYWIWR
ncbi:MAG: Nucleotidyltransferase domain protein [bacterium ADurb.Bin270]|nr:MAG: Nucleotidyltransferase domain protein [bacterium ADurb.Bin270]